MEENKNANALNLAKNLFDHGIKDVRFYDDLTHHPMIQQRISGKYNGNLAAPSTNDIGNGCQIQITSTTPINLFALNSSSTSLPSSLPIPQLLPLATNDPTMLLDTLFKAPSVPATPIQRAPRPSYKIKREELDEFSKCRLCHKDESPIQITNYEMVKKHLKRHLDFRTFQCTECTFASDSDIPVMNHMYQQHGLVNVFPNKREVHTHPHYQSRLAQCFPLYGAQQDTPTVANYIKTPEYSNLSKWTDSSQESGIQEPVPVQENNNGRAQKRNQIKLKVVTYHCYECHLPVQCVLGSEKFSDGPLILHIRNVHGLDCIPWKCDECGWKNASQWKVRRHICVRHTEKAHEVEVSRAKRTDWKLFLRKYYMDLGDEIIREDVEELETAKIDSDMTFWKSLFEKQKSEKSTDSSKMGPPAKRRKTVDQSHIKNETVITIE